MLCGKIGSVILQEIMNVGESREDTPVQKSPLYRLEKSLQMIDLKKLYQEFMELVNPRLVESRVQKVGRRLFENDYRKLENEEKAAAAKQSSGNP